MPVTISGGADPDMIVPLVREQSAITVGLTSGSTVTITATAPLPADPVYRIAVTPSAALTAIGAATQARSVAIGAAAATQFLAAVVQARSARAQASAVVSATGGKTDSRLINFTPSAEVSPFIAGATVQARGIRFTPSAALAAVGASTVSRLGEIAAGAAVQALGATVAARSAQVSSTAELQPVGARIVSRRIDFTVAAETNFVGEAASGAFDPASLFADGSEGFVYDASDVGTTGGVSDEDLLSTLSDIGGTGTDVSASGSARPQYRTDGTLHWIRWDGVDDVMSGIGGWSVGDAFTILVAGKTFDGTNNLGFITINPNGTAERSQRGVGIEDNSTLKVDARFGSTLLATDMSADSVFEGQFAASGTAGVYAAVNGGAFSSNTEDTLANTATDFALGKGLTGDEIEGRMYAIIVVNRRLSGTERDNAVAWLAEKAGVTL